MNVATAEEVALRDLETQLGYRFQDPSLLTRALTHRSGGGAHN